MLLGDVDLKSVKNKRNFKITNLTFLGSLGQSHVQYFWFHYHLLRPPPQTKKWFKLVTFSQKATNIKIKQWGGLCFD